MCPLESQASEEKAKRPLNGSATPPPPFSPLTGYVTSRMNLIRRKLELPVGKTPISSLRLYWTQVRFDASGIERKWNWTGVELNRKSHWTEVELEGSGIERKRNWSRSVLKGRGRLKGQWGLLKKKTSGTVFANCVPLIFALNVHKSGLVISRTNAAQRRNKGGILRGICCWCTRGMKLCVRASASMCTSVTTGDVFGKITHPNENIRAAL